MRYCAVLCLIFLLVACAKIVPPDGGPRDETPPELLLAVPANEGVNFRSKNIYLGFDEFVQLADINNQLIVSPPLNERPELRLKKKGLYLTFQEELLPNVTYTLNFGQGIVDYTEGNPTELIYVFSTGEVLDSLSLSGRVSDAYTGEPLEGVRVMLYKDTARNTPLEEKPYYFARSNEEGRYQFNYLADGEYRLFALKEENNNYLYDDVNELFAFSDSLVRPGTKSDSLVWPVLKLSKALDTAFYVLGFDADSSGFLRMQINKPWSPELLVAMSDSSLKPMLHFEAPDSLYAWTEKNSDSPVFWAFQTSNGVDTIETMAMKMGHQNLGVRGKLPTSVRAEDSLYLHFNRPVAYIDTTAFRMYRDSVEIDFDLSALREAAGAAPVGCHPFKLCLDAQLEDATKYRLVADSGAIRSREGFTTDSIDWAFSTYAADHYGMIKLTLELPPEVENGILEVYQVGKSDTERRLFLSASGTVEINRLLPATYKLRFINDDNANMRWDPADYTTGRFSETVWNLSDEIVVRSNWDQELIWSLR